MSNSSILKAAFLIFAGIIFGVVMVSNFRGFVAPGLAVERDVTIGAPSQLKNGSVDNRALNRAFVDVNKAVTPAVVSITVLTKPEEKGGQMNEFFHFFGPDQGDREGQPSQGAGSPALRLTNCMTKLPGSLLSRPNHMARTPANLAQDPRRTKLGASSGWPFLLHEPTVESDGAPPVHLTGRRTAAPVDGKLCFEIVARLMAEHDRREHVY